MTFNNKVVKSVQDGSIAEEAGLEPGDIIVSVNKHPVSDVFDYRFHITNGKVLLKVKKSYGEVLEIDIDKPEYEGLGIEFKNPMLDEVKECKNKCIFCFIDQLPEGLRKTLYFKDDDLRLSFLAGNYVTLTNVKIEEIDRVIKYKLSPVNVSVHTTNSDLRVFMMKNRFAGDIIHKIKKLVNGGISVNCQIVLCRGINDGKELDRSIRDLTVLHPGVNSISVVPAGLTRYRNNLPDIVPYDKISSQEVIDQVKQWQEKLLKDFGSKTVFSADEFYFMAKRKLPRYSHYENFPQLENGVGITALFKHEFCNYLAQSEWILNYPGTVSMVTGEISFGFIKDLTGILENKFDYLKVNVYKIKNNFFGENVTVTGLVTGQDIVSQLKERELGERLLIPETMLESEKRFFLDGYMVQKMEKELNVEVTIVGNSGKDLIKKIMKSD